MAKASFDQVDQLQPPEDTVFSPLEYVENQLYQEDKFEDLLDSVPSEDIRAVGANPPRVGTIRYKDGVIEDVEFDLPSDFSEW